LLGDNDIVFSDVSDEDEVEGPVGRIKGVEESDSDDADNMFRLLSYYFPWSKGVYYFFFFWGGGGSDY